MTTVTGVAQPVDWRIKDYTIKFFGEKVEGFFRGLEAEILFDENNPTVSKIVAGVNVQTLNTGDGLKNKHAKSEKGLDAKNFSMISFVSTTIIKTTVGYEATGYLMIKGIKKEIKLPFTFERLENDGVFKGKFELKPGDYNVTRHGTPDHLNIELVVRVAVK